MKLTKNEVDILIKLLHKEYGRLGHKTAGGRLLRNLQKQRYTRTHVQKIRDSLLEVYKGMAPYSKVSIDKV